MKVLLNCEESQIVTIAFRMLGHEAYSCDIEDCSGGHPEWHIKDDAIYVAYNGEWDIMIAHPPCTHLAVSGNRWYANEIDLIMESVNFAKKLFKSPIEQIGLENPVGRLSSFWRKPDQYIQPWQFGHGETKKTGLWLKNLPPLKPTKIVDGREQRIWEMPPSDDRQKERSKTYEGIAEAMAAQWGKPYWIQKELLF